MIKTHHALLVLACCLRFAGAQDTLRLRDGTIEQGRIEAEEIDALKFKAKKGKDEQTRRVPWPDVAELVYGSTPELQQALGQLAAGNRGAAMPRLQALLGGSTLRKELRPAAAFHLGSAQARNGQFAEASATLTDLVKTNANSRFLLPAARLMAELHHTNGNPDAGIAALDAALAAAKEGGVDQKKLVAFDCYRGFLLLEKKDYVNARVAFQGATHADVPGVADLAKLGIARVDAANGKVEEARNACRALVEQAQGNEALAGSWNTLAALTLQEGVAARNGERVTDAMLMYMRGVVEYAPTPDQGTSEYERSLAGAAEAFRNLADLETDEAVKKTHAQRSRQRLEQLKKEFPHSVFLPK